MKLCTSLRRILCTGILTLSNVSCEKPKEPTKNAPEIIAEPAEEADVTPQPDPVAQQKLESQTYYNAENVAAANAVIENLSPQANEAIMDAMRRGRKIEAVKLAREAEKTSLAVSKLTVEMMAIAAGIDPGIH